MAKDIALVIVALLLGFSGGYTMAQNSIEEHAHDDDHAPAMYMSHETHDASELTQTPNVTIEILKDAHSGWNVKLTTENFTFTPENASGSHDDNEGHAHLYIDGEKVARMYGQWYHIEKLSPGEHTVRATLNTNHHKYYAVDDELVDHTITITVEE